MEPSLLLGINNMDANRQETTRDDGSEELSPLLARDFETELERERELENDIQSEVQSKYDELSRELFPRFSRKRFYLACGLGIVALIVLHLFFLQRTSWSRDFRRWYGLHLTGSDVKRNYLRYSGIGNTTESKTIQLDIDNWFSNFTKLNDKSSTNLLSQDNLELTNYIQSHFKQFGFETESYNYDVPHLRKPVNSSIQLINKNKKVYNAKLLENDFETPAYHGFGSSGNATGEYIHVNFGHIEDYQRLFEANFSIKHKIVILKSELDSQITLAEKVLLAESYGAIGVINYICPSSTLSPANSDLFSLAIPRGTLNGPYTEKIPKIPTIPISYKSIIPILQTLVDKKNNPFENWDYYPAITSDKFQIKMDINFNDDDEPRTLTNIVGTLPGIFQDGCIVIGANRDSLVSSSGSSNHVVLLEIMKNYQRLIHLGWKPLRTIKFISWDGTEDGLLGSLKFINDTNLNNQPIVGYINIDSNCVTGRRFEVDANPLTHHLIRFNSKYIPLPKSLYSDEVVMERELFSTLHHYWLKQDNLTINDHLGIPIETSDSLIFQDKLAAPIINLKFSNDPKRDGSVFVPNSNLYSHEWLMKTNMDPQYYLHALLVRLVGLLGICLSEREMVDYRTNPYFEQIDTYFEDFIGTNKALLNKWHNRTVPTNLVTNWQIHQDLNLNNPEIIRFSSLIYQLKQLIKLDIKSSAINDKYNLQVQQDLQTDFPWYKYPSKLVKYAQFKVANYQLLHMERELKLSHKDIQYLNYESTTMDHIVYGLPDCLKLNITTAQECVKWSTFTNLYQAAHDKDFESTVKWLVITYEKLRKFL